LGFILSVALLIAASPQAIAKFEDQVRSKWDARQSMSSEQLREQWRNYQCGWWAYYGRAEERRSILRLRAGYAATSGNAFGYAGITRADVMLPSDAKESHHRAERWRVVVAGPDA
jgi:hypothetical protein